MCGLSLVAGDLQLKDEKVLKNLLIFNQVRGTDSSGIGVVPRWKEKEFKIEKAAVPSSVLINNKAYDRAIQGFNKVFMGHCRAATVGGISYSNAHPFSFSNILGMHNGTIYGESKTNLPDSNTFGTDSEALLSSINGRGLKETMAGIRNNGSNAWALVWYNVQLNTINIFRNSERSFFFTLSEDGKVLYGASEQGILSAALDRENVKHQDILYPIKDTWYSWVVPESHKPFDKWRSEDVSYAPFTAAPATVIRGSTGDPVVRRAANSTTIGTHLTPTNILSFPKNGVVPNGSKQEGPVPGPRHTEGEFKGLIPYCDYSLWKVFRDPTANCWVEARRTMDTSPWQILRSKHAPASLHYTKLSLNGNHVFQHIGKKKKKVIMYKGYNGKYMTQASFEEAMMYGCVGCERVPEWRNEVMFLNARDDFLCQYCSLDQGLVKMFQHSE